MDETQTILQAMRMKPPQRRKIKVNPEIEPSEFSVTNDPILSLAAKSKRAPKARVFNRWEPSDFVKYLIQSLANQGMVFDNPGARASEDMAALYDELVRRFPEKMNNELMRDYLDWWTKIYSTKLTGSTLYIRTLIKEYYINKFVQLYVGETYKPKEDIVSAVKAEQPAIDVNTLYSMGGLPMLLRSKGIVIAAKVLRDKNEPSWLMRISQTMQDFTQDAVLSTIDRTLEYSPYPCEQMVDFISIARPSLEYHRIKTYSHINYKEHFKG
jgi:hypothetical protein